MCECTSHFNITVDVHVSQIEKTQLFRQNYCEEPLLIWDPHQKAVYYQIEHCLTEYLFL